MHSQEPEQLLVLNLFGGVFVAGLGGGGRFKQIKECARSGRLRWALKYGVGGGESLSKLKGQRH